MRAWSNPLKIALTPHGRGMARRLHALAEAKGDCACGHVAKHTKGTE